MSLSNRVSNGVNANPWYHELPVWAVFPWKQSPTDQQRRRSRISETSDALFPNTQPELFHIQTTCKKLHKNLKKKLHLHRKLKQNKIISLSTFRISGLFFQFLQDVSVQLYLISSEVSNFFVVAVVLKLCVTHTLVYLCCRASSFSR